LYSQAYGDFNEWYWLARSDFPAANVVVVEPLSSFLSASVALPALGALAPSLGPVPVADSDHIDVGSESSVSEEDAAVEEENAAVDDPPLVVRDSFPGIADDEALLKLDAYEAHEFGAAAVLETFPLAKDKCFIPTKWALLRKKAFADGESECDVVVLGKRGDGQFPDVEVWGRILTISARKMSPLKYPFFYKVYQDPVAKELPSLGCEVLPGVLTVRALRGHREVSELTSLAKKAFAASNKVEDDTDKAGRLPTNPNWFSFFTLTVHLLLERLVACSHVERSGLEVVSELKLECRGEAAARTAKLLTVEQVLNVELGSFELCRPLIAAAFAAGTVEIEAFSKDRRTANANFGNFLKLVPDQTLLDHTLRRFISFQDDWWLKNDPLDDDFPKMFVDIKAQAASGWSAITSNRPRANFRPSATTISALHDMVINGVLSWWHEKLEIKPSA
jgi:hypothetical protein